MASRYFPFSQEFNSDPEGWELTDKFGDRAIRAWAEILAILDREKNQWKLVQGWDSVISRKVRQTPATVRLEVDWMLAKGWLAVGQWSASTQPEVIYAPKYGKYRKLLSGTSTPPNLTEPNLTEPTKKKIIHPLLEQKWPDPRLLIDKYNSETPDCLPAVEKVTPARLRKARDYLKIFPDEAFWSEVFKEIDKSDFLKGLRSNNGHGSFKADFDWLLTKGKDNTENVVKVYEGKYKNGH